MTPEALQSLEIARQHLAAADASLDLPIAFVAAREAYLAGYHAAMAFVLEKTGKPPKTHSGLRSEFARLARPEVRIDPKFVGFLARAYTLKSAADYGADPLRMISIEQAKEAADIARQFVDSIAELLG
ncbi:MAG TPA: HEPN domain-containing protein [Acetobacteraceae bacterium]